MTDLTDLSLSPCPGCLLPLLQWSSLAGLMSRQFLLHGSLVKFCLCKTKIALTHSRECLQHPGLVNITGEILLYILHGLGLTLPASQSFVTECNR